ncbi:histidine phosphatase family protein [Polycladidibacter stylochi]|uniref:histidine phosphatase family protein n=1 Tax=Polycladidibacter stylochi TaxID=1807766 RepID=UPI0009E7D4E7|nr:histidine phosphatase family protein [Pseudovibrio stylochi]
MSVKLTRSARLAPAPIIFIRHGQTDWNKEGRMQGHQDIPLNETGELQAEAIGERLYEFLEETSRLPADFEWLCSPMKRACQTMDIIREKMVLPEGQYRIENRLKEITFGTFEGKTLDEIAKARPEHVEGRKQDKWGFVPPEGESYQMLTSRVEAWLMTTHRPMIIVSHGGVLRALRGLLCGHPDHEVPVLEVPQDRFWVWQDHTGFWVDTALSVDPDEGASEESEENAKSEDDGALGEMAQNQ